MKTPPKNPWFKFFPTHWRADEMLGNCSLAARGLWIELLALAHRAEPRGYVLINGKPPTAVQLATQCRADAVTVAGALAELEEAGVFDRTAAGVIVSRRMVRDEEKASEGRKFAKRRYGEAEPAAEPEPEATVTAIHPAPSPVVLDAAQQMLDAWKHARLLAFGHTHEIPSEKARMHALRWVADGIPVALVSEVMHDCLKRLAERKEEWPKAITYFDAPIRKLWAKRKTAEAVADGALLATGSKEEARWRARVATFRSKGIWDVAWGPRPNEDGCLAPGAVLADVGARALAQDQQAVSREA